MDDEPQRPQCECKWPQRAVEDEACPIVYDEKMGEFQLVLDFGERGTGKSILYFCPWCGGRLPESKRGAFFTVPNESDIADVRERMESVKSVAQMYEVLGEPSEVIDNDGRVQYNYGHLYDSLELIVFEQKEPISYIVQGKVLK